ncbi:MAG: Ig-like domain-containing protein, partial [Gallionella sp.]|nr:Ig-like domain-containing protein [Gallionella sp.]
GTGTITLKKADGTLVESFDAASSDRLVISGSTLSINPTLNLLGDTQYVVNLSAGNVKDLAGNALVTAASLNFRTAVVADTTPPTVASFSPADGATGIGINSSMNLTFSEAIQRGTGSIVIRDEGNRVIESFDVASSNRLTFSNNTLTIMPTNSLVNSTRYTISLASGSVKDAAGNAYAGSSTYSFTTAASAFNISLLYSGDPTYQSYFDLAKLVWEKVIIGDIPDINGVDDLQISASVTSIDGAGGILGQASPTTLRGGSNLPFQAQMQFDSADLAPMVQNGTLLKVIMHEMGHALGFGTLWSYFGFNSTQGQYTGTNALAAYRAISGLGNAAYVPLETTGGAGTINAHWSEAVFNTELMTGIAEPNSNMPLSRLTIAAMADLGYQVNYAAADTFALA